MGIRFQCDHCQAVLNVKSELAGKKGKCPKCGEKISVPAQQNSHSGMEQAAAQSSNSTEKAATSSATGSSQNRSNSAAGTSSATVVASVENHSSAEKNATQHPAAQHPAATPLTPPKSFQSTDSVAGPSKETDDWQPSTENPDEVLEASLIEDDADSNSSSFDDAPPVPGSVDPIREDPDAVWYVCPASGGQYGPAEGDVMRRWLDEGRVAANSLVWREGWADWQVASVAFPELTPVSAPSPPAPPNQAVSQTVSASDFPGPPAAAPESGVASQPAPGPAPIDRSSHQVMAYRQRKQRNQLLAVFAIVALSLMTIGLGVMLFVIVFSGS